MVEDISRGKYFSIVENKDVNTVIYQVNKTAKEFIKTSSKYNVERLDCTEEYVGDNRKKTFYVINPAPEGNPLLIFSFGKDKVVINMGFLDYDVVRISKKPMPIKYKFIYSEEEEDYKEFPYTPNMKRPFSIIDPETTEEIKPTLYFDEEANEVKGKCRLKPNKKYFIFEVV